MWGEFFPTADERGRLKAALGNRHAGYRLDQLDAGVVGESLADRLRVARELGGAVVRTLQDLDRADAARQWVPEALRYAGLGSSPTKQEGNFLGEELEFGPCDTGVIFMGPRSNKDALVVTFFRAVQLAMLSHPSSEPGAIPIDTKGIASVGGEFKLGPSQFLFLDRDGIAVADTPTRYAAVASPEPPLEDTITEGAKIAASLLSAVWEKQPTLFANAQGKGPLFLVREGEKSYLLAPSASADYLAKELGAETRIVDAQCERFARAAGLTREGGCCAFEIVRKEEAVPQKPMQDLSPTQALYKYFNERVGLPSYSELVAILRGHFDVVESRSDGKGAHGALFRKTEEGRQRFTTCTSIRSISDPMRFHILLDILECLRIEPAELLAVVQGANRCRGSDSEATIEPWRRAPQIQEATYGILPRADTIP